MKSKKILSILLAVIMMLSVVPFYASAAAETLTASNIQTLPTITMKENVTVYTGNYQDTVFSVADDEVVVDAAGNQVAGHFVIRNSGAYSAGEFTVKNVNLTFMPDDTEAYTSFTKNRVTITPVTVTVEKADLALKDAENDSPKTSEAVPSGTAISDIRITGGACYIVQAPTTTTYITNLSWTWQDTSLTVTESGYYNAVPEILPGNFNDFVLPVYIEVESSIKATTIVEAPTATIEYGQAWNEVVFEGGKVMAGDTEVSGTFTSKSTSTGKPSAGVFDGVPVIFTPDDLEKYTTCEGYGTVTVTPAVIRFIDENGETITPEITVPYGTKFDMNATLGSQLKKLLNVESGILLYTSFYDMEGNEIENRTVIPFGENEYKLSVSTGTNKNYEDATLIFKVIVEPATVEMTLSNSFDKEQTINIIKVNSNDPNPQGTFDIYVDGTLYMEDVKGSFPFDPGKSGKYEIRMVYNPVENDPCIVEEITRTWTETYHRNLTKGDLVMGGSPSVMFGKEVTLRANITPEDFGGWKITDANGNEVDLGIDLTALNITFSMPDYDITAEIIDKREVSSGDDTTGGIDNIFGDLTEGDSDNPIVNIFNNIIAFFKNIIETIKNFFRGIGDRT